MQEVQPVEVGRLVRTLKLLALTLGKIGLGLMALAAIGLVFIYIPLGVAEARYALANSTLGRGSRKFTSSMRKGITINAPTPTLQPHSKFKPVPPPAAAAEWKVPDPLYSIYIPKIMATSKVIPNVNAGKPDEYFAALQRGVAEAAGLAHPGETGTTYLFAHSVGSRVDFARYNAVFYLLDKMTLGDTVEIVYQGRLYTYSVTAREVIDPKNTQYLIPQTTEEKLVLQTCYPPGTTWKRLVVVAKRSN